MKIRGMLAYNPKSKLYVAMSLEFGLAAQAFTEQEAKQKLIAQITEYLEEAISIDKKQQNYFLNRKAPFAWYLRYYWVALREVLQKSRHSLICYQSSDDYTKHA
jgi:hypothetical protein